MVLGLLARGVLLGLGAAAPIGPVNVEIARRTLRYGRAAGFSLGCGAVTVDVGYALVTSVTILPVKSYPGLVKGLGIAGGLFLAYLAFLCLRGALRGHDQSGANPAKSQESGSTRARHYVQGLLMTALNPMTLMFWFVGVPATAAGLAGQWSSALPVICAGVFLGAFAWVCFFTMLIGRLGKFGGQRWLAAIDIAGALLLLVFAGMSIWRVLSASL